MKTYSFEVLTLGPSSGIIESEARKAERNNARDQNKAARMLKPVWRVLAMDPVRMVWTVRSTHDDMDDAQEAAEALQHRDQRLRVRVKPGKMRMLEIKPAVVNSTTHFRQSVAARMSDLADARKYYKSPG